MAGPSIEELAKLLAGRNKMYSEPEVTATKPVLNLQDQNIPAAAFLPLEEEITDVERMKLADSLINYINKMDFPPRFKNTTEAYRYFEIRSDAQIMRLNELAESLKNPTQPTE